MSIKLRDLIRAVRACKTAAEERGVISTECALIRTAIKEEDEKFRHRNVAKLMYINMLGYPTHFGQMECLKLISAQGFPEKRIGYLALTLLLSEQTEVLTLVTNSLKVDLTHTNQYIQGLSLIVIGNMATPDMARDLCPDVEKLLKCGNPYLRKKAALATIRLLKREPDLIEHMSELVMPLFKDRAHGVLITGLQLMIEILDLQPEMKDEYIRVVPALVRLLRSFISMGFSPEHDVGGITDPFIQVKLLTLMRKLGKDHDEASEMMNDVLAQVATNTESAKNAGNAILYECVQTIMEVQSESSLRVLAINILGRFLLNRDNNIRYVALNSLTKVVKDDIAAVQRHRNTIVECLKDADISIRSRALELIYQLVNESNVQILTTELLNYLIVANSDQKSNLVSKILQIIEKYSPNKKWRIDTLCTMLSVSGSILDENVSRTSILFIAQSEGYHGYAVHRLHQLLLEDTDQIGMLHTALWCIGEYGELLTQQCPSFNGDDAMGGAVGGYPGLQEKEILSLVDKCMRLHNSDTAVKSLGLNALIKLSVRFHSSDSTNIIKRILKVYSASMNVELQQRGVEYCALLSDNNSNLNNIRNNLLGKMPIIDENTLRKKRMTDMSAGSMDASSGASQGGGGDNDMQSSVPLPSGGGGLLDLDDIFGGGGGGSTQQTAEQSNNASSAGGMDLLADVFSTNANVSTPANNSNVGGNNGNGGLLDLMGSPGQPTDNPPQPPQNDIFSNSSASAPASAPAPAPVDNGIEAFNKNGFIVNMKLSKPDNSNQSYTSILFSFANTNQNSVENLSFQAAVPKYLKLEMHPPTSTTINSNTYGQVTQEIRVTNTMQGEKNILLKLKIGYTINGAPIDEMATVSNFPALY
jgi:AP-1 complex subunit gamma-1